MHGDINRDELRRELRAVDAEQREALPRWHDALHRIFADRAGSDIPARAKARLLGVPQPGRRQLFRYGGATLAGAAVLAACGDESQDIAKTGTTLAEEPSATGPDLVLLRTATSLELLAVNAYNAAIDTQRVTTEAVVEAMTLFTAQHEEHAAQLQAVTENAGGKPYEEPNEVVFDTVVQPALPTLTSEPAIIAFAASLEDTAAQTYAFAAGTLTTPELRQAIMAIGGVEARHLAILRKLQSQTQVPVAFLPTTAAVPQTAYVPET